MNDEQFPTMWTTGWLPNGAKVSFTVPMSYTQAFEEALAFTNGLLAKGFLLHEPGLEAGEEKERIVTVMRREKASDNTPIIDMYPAWGAGGDEPFGTYKYLHIYLNTPEDSAAFLAAAGLKTLDQIPLYDGQAPLKRTAGKKHAKEFSVPTAFFVVRKQGKEKTSSDGQPYHPWEFVRYEYSGDAPAPQPNIPAGDLKDKLGAGKPEARRMGAEPAAAANGNASGDVLLMNAWPVFNKLADMLFQGKRQQREMAVAACVKEGIIDPKTDTVQAALDKLKKYQPEQLPL